MSDFIPVNEPLLDGNERQYLLECIESGWISSEGPFIKQFEEKFAASLGRKHGIAVSNGTAAIDAAVDAQRLRSSRVLLKLFDVEPFLYWWIVILLHGIWT
jgi:dTDP-4-amino-4,6-dideoxygalactose transaminase